MRHSCNIELPSSIKDTPKRMTRKSAIRFSNKIMPADEL